MQRTKLILPSSTARLVLRSLRPLPATSPDPFSKPTSSFPPSLPFRHESPHLFAFNNRPKALSFSSLAINPPQPLPETELSEPTTAPTQESVLYVLKKLDKKPEKALNFFNCISSKYGFKPNATAYNVMLRVLGHKDWMKDFWVIARKMEEHGHDIDRGTYLTLLIAFKKQRMTTEASALTQFYNQATEKAASDSGVRAAVEIVLGSKEGWSEEDTKRLGEFNPSLSDWIVIKVLREVRDYPFRALGFFRWAGSRPDYKHGSVTYNAMVRILGRKESISEFWSLVEEMKGEGHEMDIDTYIKLSRQFQKSKLVKEAVELYEFMMDSPYKPSIHDCGLLLRQISLADKPDLDLVFRVVKRYEANGHSLSKVVYDGIHRSLTGVGRFEEAEQILQKMKDAGFEPDNITYSQLVFGLCKVNRLDDACKVLDEMEDGGCTPDLKTWTVLIQGHCSVGEIDKALTCFTKMIEKNYDADGDLLDVLVKGLCSKSRESAAHSLVVEMIEKAQVKPWQATYKFLIQILLGEGKLEEALKLLGLMKKHNFPPFADPFAQSISKYGTTEDAKEFLKVLSGTSFPSYTSYLNVFKAFFKEGRYSEAQDLLFKCPHHIRKHADITKLFGSIKHPDVA